MLLNAVRGAPARSVPVVDECCTLHAVLHANDDVPSVAGIILILLLSQVTGSLVKT